MNNLTTSAGSLNRTAMKSNGNLNKSMESLEVKGMKHEPLLNTISIDAGELNSAAGDDMVNMAEPTQMNTIQTDAEKKARARTAKKSMRSMSLMTFNTMGSSYNVPIEDHSYHIKYAPKIGKGVRYPHKSQTYMAKVIERAKSSIDPRKYTPQVDWYKNSKMRPNLALDLEKRVTVTEKIMRDKKKIPSVHFYKNLDPNKRKIPGFYGSSTSKVTIFESINFAKKEIPGPSKYESRGKSMSDILKGKAKAFLFKD